MLDEVFSNSICFHACRVKDWIVFVRRNSSSNPPRDVVRDRISDELTSLIVWCAVAVVCVDALSLRLGIAVGTYRALHCVCCCCTPLDTLYLTS